MLVYEVHVDSATAECFEENVTSDLWGQLVEYCRGLFLTMRRGRGGNGLLRINEEGYFWLNGGSFPFAFAIAALARNPCFESLLHRG
jgi:hypothetical protein